MTEDQLVDDIFEREGDRYGDEHTVPRIDQPTGAGGITLGTLRAYVADTGAALAVSVDTLRALTRRTAAPIVRWNLERLSKDQRFSEIDDTQLRLQMLDFAYNSGPSLAIRWLQRVLRVPRTGVMDRATLAALAASDEWLVNQALVGARLQMIDMWTDADKQRKAWEEGLESRGLLFSQLEIP